MILVVGASGRLGGLVARTLVERGDAVRVLVRGPAAPDGLTGAEVVHGDLKDAASLRAACDGVQVVVTTANSAQRGGVDTVDTVDRAGNRSLVDAAAAAGVGRFLFVSTLGASADSPAPLMRAKGETEQHLQRSGVPWTILQPNLFMDFWVPAVVGPALAGGPMTIVGEGRRRHSFMALRDLAAYAVAVLDRPDADRTLVLGGPEPLSWRDVATRVEQVLGRSVELRSVRAGEPVPGLPPAVAELLTALDTYDSPIDMSALSSEYGIRPTSLADLLPDLLARLPASEAPQTPMTPS